MHEMLTILTVCVSLACSSSWLHCAKMAEQIKMLFGVNTPGGPRNIVLDVGPDVPTERWRGVQILNFWTSLISSEWQKLET